MPTLPPLAPGTEAADQPPQGLYDALSCFRGRVLIVLSGNGASADGMQEFSAAQLKYAAWRKVCASPLWQQVALPQADAAFAQARWRDEVARITTDWLRSW